MSGPWIHELAATLAARIPEMARDCRENNEELVKGLVEQAVSQEHRARMAVGQDLDAAIQAVSGEIARMQNVVRVLQELKQRRPR